MQFTCNSWQPSSKSTFFFFTQENTLSCEGNSCYYSGIIFFLIFIYLFTLAVLGLRCCARAFSSCGKRELLFVAVHSLLIAVASLVAEHGL